MKVDEQKILQTNSKPDYRLRNGECQEKNYFFTAIGVIGEPQVPTLILNPGSVFRFFEVSSTKTGIVSIAPNKVNFPKIRFNRATMRSRSLLLATIICVLLLAPPSFGQSATDLGAFTLNGCLTFDKNNKVYLVRRSADFVGSVHLPAPGEAVGGIDGQKTSAPVDVDGNILPVPAPAVAGYHGPIAGRFRSSRIQIRRTSGFDRLFAANSGDNQPFGLVASKDFVLPEADAFVLHSAQTSATLDNTNRAIQNLHERLLVGFERSSSTIKQTPPPLYRGSLVMQPTIRRPEPTQDELNVVDQILFELFLDAVADRMNTYIRSLGKTTKADLAATAYEIIKQGRTNGSLLLSEVVAFMLNELDVPEKTITDSIGEISPLRFHAACRTAGLLDLNGIMSDSFYAAFVQVVAELGDVVRTAGTPNIKSRLEALYLPFDPDSHSQERELREKIHTAGLDMVNRLERLTAENGFVDREELVDAVGRLLFDLGILREGTITSLQERLIVDTLQNLEEIEPEVCAAIVDAFLDLDATRPTFRGQVEPCMPVCRDPKAWKHDIWFEGFGNFTNQGSMMHLQGFSGETWGLNMGVERRIGHSMVFGAGFSGAFGTMRTADRMMRGDSDSYLFTLYGAATQNDWTLSGAVGFSFIDYGTERFADLDRFRSSHDGSLLTGSLMLSRSFQLDQSRLTPFIGFNVMNLHEDEFTGTDADAEELIFGAKSTTAFMQTLGVRLSGEQKLRNGWIVSPSVSAGWLHDYGSGQLSAAARYDGGPAFVVDGVTRNQNRAVLGFSLGTQCGSRLNVFASYNGELSTNYSTQTGQVGVNIAF